jgi:hypothetical protein
MGIEDSDLSVSDYTRRVPLDKEKGFVKDEDILSGAEHRFFGHQREFGTETLGYHRCIIFLVDRSTEPSIRPKLRP